MTLAAVLAGTVLTAGAWEMTKVNIATEWAADVSPENVHQEYPRPQMVRGQWMNLNGLWQWQSLKKMDGELSETAWREILVPFAPEAPLSGIGRHSEAMAYRCTFHQPEMQEGDRLLLHFEAVDWRCEAFVNGTSVGTHEGGYDPFTFDISNTLMVYSGGVHEIVLRVYDPTDNDAVPRGKQVLSPGGIFYTCTSGIWQTVWLEVVPRTYIADYHVVPDIDKGTATFTVTAAGDTPAEGTTFNVVVRHGEDIVASGSAVVGTELALAIPDAELWEPDHPFLYDATITLGGDEVETYFGMRKISLLREGSWYRLALNNRFLFQMGPLDQGFWPDGVYTAPSDEALKSDIVTMKRMGFNMVRKHIKVEPRRWYYWCDRLGLMVWQDMPGENYGGKGGVADNGDYFERELTALVETHFNAPSIIMWVLFNEGGGQTSKSYTKRFVDLVRKLDKSRLINEASGWNHHGYGDVKDIHPYPAPSFTTTSGKQATACGEYGGVQYVLDGHLWASDHWGYASVESPEELDDTYTTYARKLAFYKSQKGLSAAVYTQLTDVEVEVNGLMSYDRVVKSDINRLFTANRIAIEGEGQPISYLLSPADENPETWRYTTDPPNNLKWYTDEYDDSEWREGLAGFGANGLSNMHYGTKWTTSNIWIRRTLDLDITAEELAKLTLRIYYDEDTDFYINGVLAFSATGYVTDYKTVTLSDKARAAINPHGTNILAAHTKQTSGGQFIDIALYIDTDSPQYSASQVVRSTVQYSRSSELSFTIGVAADTTATEPEYTIDVRRIPFAKATAAPVLGLDDSRLVTAQELLFDVSTLLAKVDAKAPVKLFFYVNTTTQGAGEGTVTATTYEDSSTGSTLAVPFTPQSCALRGGKGGGQTQAVMTTVFNPATAPPKPDDTTVIPNGDLGFEVAPAVVTKGRKVWLHNLSEINESRLVWMITSSAGTTTQIAGSNTSFTPDAPGTYSVTQLDVLTGAELTVPKAFTVCNAASGNGALFSHNTVAHIWMGSPLKERSYKYTLDWWMRPEKTSEGCLTINDPDSEQFRLTIADRGVMSVVAGGKEALTPAGFVIPDEWHHYAVVYYYSRFYFYRDGVLVHNAAGPSVSQAWQGMNIEGQRCIIDEFRFWANRLTQDRLREVCLRPLDDPTTVAASSDALTVYLNFDAYADGKFTNLADPSNSAEFCRGVSSMSSDGVFCFDFSTSTAKPVDVTADYLTNYCAPFLHTDDSVVEGYADRFLGLETKTEASRWDYGGLNPSLLAVDGHRGSTLLVQNGWFGPMAESENRLVLQQIVSLPAGYYTFSVVVDEAEDAWASTLYAQSVSWAPNVQVPLADGSVSFIVPHGDDVGLGVQFVLPAYGRVRIKSFKLVRHPVTALVADGEELPAIVDSPLLSEGTGETLYDLQGRRVLQPAIPGIYIRAGKKVLIR